MDILRKELNDIYAAQHLETEILDSETLAAATKRAEALAEATGACEVITDASCDRCYIFPGRLGMHIGIADTASAYKTADSSDEDEIYNLIHPEDLVDKRMLEYEFFKMVDSLAPEEKTSYRAECRFRMRNRDGEYRVMHNTTRVCTLSPRGGIWLILCGYDLSADQSAADGIDPHIVNNLTGRIISLSFGEKRKQVLSVREKEILRLIRSGRPSKQIAALLGISINTVNRHRQNIIGKLSVGNCVEAITAATAMGLLD